LAPAVIGDLLDEFDFHASDGGERFVDVPAVGFVGHFVLRGEDEDLACETVTVGVQGAGIARFRSY
jgi:hypothetical protein